MEVVLFHQFRRVDLRITAGCSMSDGVGARNDRLRNRTLLMNGQRQVAGGADWWLSFAYRARHSSNGHSNVPFARVHREYGSNPVQSVHATPDAFAGVILDLTFPGIKLHPSTGETGSQEVGRQAFQGGSFFAYDRTTTEDLKSRRFPAAQPAGKFPAQPPLVYCLKT